MNAHGAKRTAECAWRKAVLFNLSPGALRFDDSEGALGSNLHLSFKKSSMPTNRSSFTVAPCKRIRKWAKPLALTGEKVCNWGQTSK